MGVYSRPDSSTLWMSLQINGRRVRINTMVTDWKVANDLFAAWRTEVARERWLGPPPLEYEHSVQDLITQYLTVVTPRKSLPSQQRDQGILKRFALRWGELQLQELRPDLLEQYLTERINLVSFATASKEMGILKAAYRCAIRWGWIRSSPFVGIVLNQEGTARLRWLSDDEEARLLAACPAHVRDIAVVGLDAGLRPGNLIGLQQAWVQPAAASLVIPREQTKTKKLPIVIPLTKRATGIVHTYLEKDHSQYLFLSNSGRPYRTGEINRVLHRVAKRIGLRDVCLYTLRHTFISRLVRAGRPLPEIAALAGHRDIRTTLRYAHLAPQSLRESIDVLEPTLK